MITMAETMMRSARAGSTSWDLYRWQPRSGHSHTAKTYRPIPGWGHVATGALLETPRRDGPKECPPHLHPCLQRAVLCEFLYESMATGAQAPRAATFPERPSLVTVVRTDVDRLCQGGLRCCRRRRRRRRRRRLILRRRLSSCFSCCCCRRRRRRLLFI